MCLLICVCSLKPACVDVVGGVERVEGDGAGMHDFAVSYPFSRPCLHHSDVHYPRPVPTPGTHDGAAHYATPSPLLMTHRGLVFLEMVLRTLGGLQVRGRGAFEILNPRPPPTPHPHTHTPCAHLHTHS